MEHVDPDVLALAALGEPLTDADAQHLAVCETCAAEVESFRAVVHVGRSVTAEDALVAPAPAVWERIGAELGLGGGSATPSATVTSLPGAAPQHATHAAVPAAQAPPAPEAAPAQHVSQTEDRLAPVVPLRRRSAPWIAAAAAAGVVIGGAGGTWLAGRDQTVAPSVVAQAALDPLPGWDASGQAVIEQTADGGRELVLSLEGATGDDGFREVWLIDRDVTRLVSLGVLEGSEGRFTVPAGLDLSDFAVVDVSEEPYDGVPAHSGDSIIRGILDT